MEYMTIKQLKEKYSVGTTPKSVIEEVIRRSQELSDRNIWITSPDMKMIKPYLEQLSGMDRDLPLWGVPFAIKDNIDLKGVPTTAACPAYAYIPEKSAEIVERLVAAGAIPVGKTNLDQFATGLVGTRSPYGECKNSIDPDYISGGSSSGSAVAVAMGLCVFSLGTDTAGSGRVPAALNNICGIKPSIGVYPKTGVVPACESLDCVTVFAADFEDAMTVDAASRGFSADDPWSRNITKIPAQCRKMLLPETEPEFYGDFAGEYRICFKKFCEDMKTRFDVEYIPTEIFSQTAAMLYGGPWISERWAALGDFVTSHSVDIFPVTRGILESGKGEEYSAADLFTKQHLLQENKRIVRNMLKGAVFAMPTCGGTFTRDQVRNDPVATNSKMGLYTNHCNLLDLCALAIPYGVFDTNGTELPFGITLFALSDEEGMAESAARKILRK